MPRLIVFSGRLPAGIIELKPGSNFLGRAATNDIKLDDPAVSGQHCEIRVDQDVVRVKDLNSTNGVYIDRHLTQEACLFPGQVLRVGTVDLVLEIPPATGANPLATSNPASPGKPDHETVAISIPPLPIPEIETPTFLPDGSPACLHHPQVHATLKCTRCELYLCETCARSLKRIGGQLMRFCPDCSGQCRALEWQERLARREKSLGDIFRNILRFLGRCLGRTGDRR